MATSRHISGERARTYTAAPRKVGKRKKSAAAPPSPGTARPPSPSTAAPALPHEIRSTPRGLREPGTATSVCRPPAWIRRPASVLTPDDVRVLSAGREVHSDPTPQHVRRDHIQSPPEMVGVVSTKATAKATAPNRKALARRGCTRLPEMVVVSCLRRRRTGYLPASLVPVGTRRSCAAGRRLLSARYGLSVRSSTAGRSPRMVLSRPSCWRRLA